MVKRFEHFHGKVTDVDFIQGRATVDFSGLLTHFTRSEFTPEDFAKLHKGCPIVRVVCESESDQDSYLEVRDHDRL